MAYQRYYEGLIDAALGHQLRREQQQQQQQGLAHLSDISVGEAPPPLPLPPCARCHAGWARTTHNSLSEPRV